MFSYNGFGRLGDAFGSSAGCNRPSTYLVTAAKYSARHGFGTFAIPASWDRLLHGPFGHDDAWLLLPAVVAAVWLLVRQRRRPRTDPLRAAVILWSAWLVLTFGFFSGIEFLNSYYTAALGPAVAALCGMGAAAAWRRRRHRAVRGGLAALTAATVAVTVALVPAYAGVRPWIVASTVVVGLLAVGILVASLRPGHGTVWAISVGPVLAAAAMLLGSAWASAAVVQATLGPFDSPFAPVAVNRFSQEAAYDFPINAAGARDVRRPRPGRTRPPTSSRPRAWPASPSWPPGASSSPSAGSPGACPHRRWRNSERFVAEGRVRRVTVTTNPLTRTPDLRWVVAHCTRTPVHAYDAIERATRTVFYCAPRARPATAAVPLPAPPVPRPCEVQEVRHPHELQQATTDRPDVLAVGIVHDLGVRQLVLAPARDEAHGAVGQGVAHPLGVTPVGQGEAEAVLRAEHVDRRAVDGTGPPTDVDHDAEAGQHAGQVDGDLVRDGPVEARHAAAEARRARRHGPRPRLGGVRAHTSVSPPSTARTCPVM